MGNKERDVWAICSDEDFSQRLNGNVYCSLSRVRKIDCRFHSELKDKNGLYPCLNPIYQEDTMSKYTH